MQPHVVPIKTYLIVAAWLALLMVVTVSAAAFDLGIWNTPIAMAIALAKAALIVLFFMHVRYGTPLLRIFAAGGFLWLLILFGLTMSDVLTRG
jgi:cytochrome c oxidase subunit IV